MTKLEWLEQAIQRINSGDNKYAIKCINEAIWLITTEEKLNERS